MKNSKNEFMAKLENFFSARGVDDETAMHFRNPKKEDLIVALTKEDLKEKIEKYLTEEDFVQANASIGDNLSGMDEVLYDDILPKTGVFKLSRKHYKIVDI